MPIKSSRVEADIILQSLSEIIMRNQLGGFQISDITKTVDPNTITQFSDVSAKGYIYSSLKFCIGSSSQKNDIAWAIVDGVISATPTLDQLNLFNINGLMQAFPYITCFDETNFLYTIAWPASLTFETSFSDWWYEKHGNTPTVRVGLLFTII